MYSFYAMLSRMKNVNRWPLMRNTKTENICEHSHDVAVLVHALALLHNKRFGGTANVEKCVLMALYHDATETLTGDMPTPVKYHNPELQNAYKQLETVAAHKLLTTLPDDLQDDYQGLLLPENGEEHQLMKAADRLAALIKCMEELKQGNREFETARQSVETSLREMHLPAVDCFMEEFLPAYEKTLDEL